MLRFMIVDDDEDDRELFSVAVRDVEPSAACLMAQNGHEALHNLVRGVTPKPDVIFLDLNMPRLNGVQTLTELKKNELLKEIPVVIYTTSKLDDDKEETARLGAAAFITKPTSLAELQQVIEHIIREHLHIVLK
jgi:CheY-like chemotaxis protein